MRVYKILHMFRRSSCLRLTDSCEPIVYRTNSRCPFPTESIYTVFYVLRYVMRQITDLQRLWSKTSIHLNLYCFVLILFSVLCGDFRLSASCTFSFAHFRNFLYPYWRDLFVFLRLVWLVCLILLPRSLLANNSMNETDNQIAWLIYQVCCFDILQQICSLNRAGSTHRENHSIKILRIIFCTQIWKSSKPHSDRQGAVFSQNTVHKYLIIQCKDMDLLDFRVISSCHLWELDRC